MVVWDYLIIITLLSQMRISMVSIYTRQLSDGLGLRMIYPCGKVEFCYLNKKGQWSYSCLSRDSKAAALKAMRHYDKVNGYGRAKYVGRI